MTRFLPFPIVVLLILTTPPLHSSAQTNEKSTPESWDRAVPKLLATELTSNDADRRGDAMLKVIQYGTYSDGSIQWQPVVQPLLAIYQSDADYRIRRRAVAALHATGHPNGMKALRSLVHEESSPKVLYSTIHALVDYYGLQTFAGDREMARLAETVLLTTKKKALTISPQTADRQ